MSLPKGTAGFSNLLCQMREFRDLRESFHCNVKVGVLRTLPIQISTNLLCSREDRLCKISSHYLFCAYTQKNRYNFKDF